MSKILDILFGKMPFEKEREEFEIKREIERRLYPQKKQDAESSLKVLRVSFRCANCSYVWTFDYPKGIQVGYSAFGKPSSENSWIIDNFTYDENLYDYDCPNCSNNDIEIIKREALKT
jgi:Zn finger protein HypA/HybF involved in hydrogenase expression